MDDAKCFAFVRQRRWPDGIRCPACDNDAVIRDGHNDTQLFRRRYRCKAYAGRFNNLTGTVLAEHHQPLQVWVLCFHFMGLNLSTGRSPLSWAWMRTITLRWIRLRAPAFADRSVSKKGT